MANDFLLKKAPKLAAIIDPKLPFIEIAVMLIVILAELTKTSNQELSKIIIPISISFLSVLYYFNSFRIDEGNKNVYRIFLTKLGGFTNTICIVGLIFLINHYKGGNQMIVIGILTQLSILVFTFGLKYFKKGDAMRRVDIIRSMVLILLVGSMYFSSRY